MPVVTGDTKVVERGKADGVFITTTGVGVLPEGIDCPATGRGRATRCCCPGTIGDHGMAIMSSARKPGLRHQHPVGYGRPARPGRGDGGRRADARCLRDPTRGGAGDHAERNRPPVAASASCSTRPPFRCEPEVAAACELLGLDPLYVANEGKLVAICPADEAERLLAAMRAHPLGRGGRQDRRGGRGRPPVRADAHRLGGRRIVDWLTGEQLPRIC